MPDLPSGTVTFLFTDVEGSTKLLHELGAEGYAEALAGHRRILREAFTAHGGVEVDTQGDAFFVAFPTAPGALRAAAEALEGLVSGPIRVRVGIHTGTPHVAEEGYVGGDVHRAARIAAAGHGGQVLVSSSTASLLATEGLRDLGEHRLKDLSAPERIYQLGDGEFPPLASLHQTNLPIPATPFLGRERELAELTALLARDDLRLLTLAGPGGTGKTRLALQAAGAAADAFAGGVWWVPLAPLRDPELVLETAGQALGARDGLAEHIADKQLLLFFDNFEHLIDSAAGLAELLAACPNLHLLVTSRELLRVPGEQAYPVAPLEPQDGTKLFLARARAALPSFVSSDAVPELCARLEQLPLALELAAARVPVLSPEQLLERLSKRLDLLKAGRGVDPRQQTLRATIEWSHDLLDEDERRLFARLAVFRGGCTLETAEQVCAAELDTLHSLVDKSLVRLREDERFWMLETIREYADERLEASGEDEAIRDRHLNHFVALAELAYEERLASLSGWLPTLDAEHDNIRAALDRAGESNTRAEAQLAGAIAYFWLFRGHMWEARERLATALGHHESRDVLRARALTYLGEIVGRLGNGPEAVSYLDEALELWQEKGDALGEAFALTVAGLARGVSGEPDEARAAYQQSLAVLEKARGPELERARPLAGLCELLVSAGEVEHAEPLARELYELGTAHDAPRTRQSALHYLADCPLIRGDYGEAERRYLRSLTHARAAGILPMRATELNGVAMSLAGQGDASRAVRLAAAAEAELEALGYKGGRGPAAAETFWTRLHDWYIGGARAQLPPDEVEEAERAGREAPFDEVLDEVLGQGDQ